MTAQIKKQVNCNNMLKLSLCFFIVAVFGQLYVSNELAVKGKEMIALEERKASIQKDISELKLESSYYSSLSFIESEAKRLGFVENTNYVSAITPTIATAVVTSF